MKKQRLAILMDVALVAALMKLISDYHFPWSQTLENYWALRSEYIRGGVSVVWLVALWLGLYRPWDRAERVSPPVVLLGVARVLCTLMTVSVTFLIINHRKSWLSQSIYGAVALASVAVDYLLLLCLERANADVPGCAEVSRRWRGVLMGAFIILAAGLALTNIKYRRAMWISTSMAAVYLLAFWIAGWVDKDKGE